MSKKTSHFRKAIDELYRGEISSVKGIPTPVVEVFCTNRKPTPLPPLQKFEKDPSVAVEEDFFCSGGGSVCQEFSNHQNNFRKLDEEDFRYGDPGSMAEVRDEAFGSRAGMTPEVFCPKTGSRSGKPVSTIY